MSLADPEVVRAVYASEDGLQARRSIYVGAEGKMPGGVASWAIATGHPRRVREVGFGPGELSARMTAAVCYKRGR